MQIFSGVRRVHAWNGRRDSSALQDDRRLRPAIVLTAGMVSVLALVGLFVTSPFRAPEPRGRWS